MDETYVRIAGGWRYLYRAVGPSGATLDFYLSESYDALRPGASSAKNWLPSYPRPRVISVNGNPAYPKVVEEVKQEWKLGRRCRCRTWPYLNNIVEQDHRAIKRPINSKQGFRSFQGARRTISGYEGMQMIRKGQVRWLLKGDVIGQVLFIQRILGLTAV